MSKSKSKNKQSTMEPMDMDLTKISFVPDTDMQNDDDEVDEGSDPNLTDDQSEKDTQIEVEPPAKKLKPDLGKIAEDELIVYQEISTEPTLPLSEKFIKITAFLDSLHENNINTLQFQTDFSEWSKNVLLTLLNEVSETSVEYYKFLCSVLKVSPTIFESICDNILTVSYSKHCSTSECNIAYETFMTKLVYTFERLRRFPKLVSKLLRCVRDNIVNLNFGSKKPPKRMTSKNCLQVLAFTLPKAFLESYSEVVSMLTLGQVTDLWKTLLHNLEEECVKKLGSNACDYSLSCLLLVVVELVVTFLYNIKAIENTASNSTKKIDEILKKLEDTCLVPLGKILEENVDTHIMQCFLKLTDAWGRLHQLTLIYGGHPFQAEILELGKNQQIAENLSSLFPFLSAKLWEEIWKLVNQNEDSESICTMVNLIGLKLKWLVVIGGKTQSRTDTLALNKDDNTTVLEINESNKRINLQHNAKACAKLIWSQQNVLQSEETISNRSNEDLLDLALSYLDNNEFSQHAKFVLDNILLTLDKPKLQESKYISSNTFKISLIMEAFQEALELVGGCKAVKKHSKQFLADYFNVDFKIKMLENTMNTKGDNFAEIKDQMLKAVQVVNEVLNDKINQKPTRSEDQKVLKLAKLVSFIATIDLHQYPKTIKTFAFLNASLLFIGVMEKAQCKTIVEQLVDILCECGQNSQGNEFLFQINWAQYYNLVHVQSDSISVDSINKLCSFILENVYVSPKVAGDFGDNYIQLLCDNFEFTTSKGQLGISILDYIVRGVIETKSKSALLLLNHLKKLANVAVNKLSDGTIITDLHSLIHTVKKKKKKGVAEKTTVAHSEQSCTFVSAVMRTCYLLLKGKSHMSTEDASVLNVIVLPYLHFALDFLEDNKTGGYEPIKSDEAEVTAPLFNCSQCLIESLKAFEEYRLKLSENFLVRLWECIMIKLTNRNDKQSGKKLLTSIFEVAGNEEFDSICRSITEKLVNECRSSQHVAFVLSSLIDAKLSVEKTQIRGKAIEFCLYKYLEQILLWSENENFIGDAIPYLEFQTALSRRRKPMGNLSTLAVCLSSITAVPLEKADTVTSFKTIFSVICDLLNAITIHRLDVLSYRSHVFVQCFQFLVESLVKRADQKNKLADGEIYKLRHCGHCIERICQSAKLGSKELGRVAPYLVVVLLRQFEKITVYPVVKAPLLNGCYKLLDMCDARGISHVNSMLSVGSREIFKTVYELYKKFYRYKGKV